MDTKKTLFIMQGIPGSGKSTMAKLIADKHEAIIFSTDDFWYDYAEDGKHYTYNYDPARIDEAHRWNQQRCAKEMIAEDGGNIVIDNTNIQRWQAHPYLVLASIFEYDVQVISVQVPVEVAIARQAQRPVDRQIPEEVIRRMHSEMEVLL